MNDTNRRSFLQKFPRVGGITLIAAGWLVAVVAMSSPAFALDAYQDRRGLMGGVMGGGGVVFTPDDVSGVMGLGVQFGGGATEWLTIAATVDLYWLPALEQDALALRPGVQIRGFVVGGLFGELNAGMVWLAQEGDDELGIAVGVGIGYEFFVGASQAISLSLGYERHAVFDADDGNVVLVRLGSTWY